MLAWLPSECATVRVTNKVFTKVQDWQYCHYFQRSIPIYLLFLLYLNQMILVNVKLDILSLRYSLVYFITHGTAKTKFSILVFLYSSVLKTLTPNVQHETLPCEHRPHVSEPTHMRHSPIYNTDTNYGSKSLSFDRTTLLCGVVAVYCSKFHLKKTVVNALASGYG